MTRDDIIRMAREAGFQEGDGACVDKLFSPHGYDPYSLTAELERFAHLVAAAEREACAKVCLDIGLACEVRQGADGEGDHQPQ